MNPEIPLQTYTAGDVKNASGMSYRQINTWDTKGNLPNQREKGSTWRKFSSREIFTIMVCKEIRDRFGTPLESLRFVRDFMLQDDADHLQAAVDIMRHGFAVFILTDLKKTFVMDSDLEFEDMLHYGYLRASENQAYVFIQVNHLVNRLLGCLKKSAALHIHDKVYEAVREARADPILRNEHELAIIRALREGDYKRVTLTKKNDEEVLLELDLSVSEAA
jgi:DNA-binding transcriptional MerR regulator